MKIVHIEDFFHPDAGYQINILTKYMARDGHDVYIITSEMDKLPDYLTAFFGTSDIEEKDNNFEKLTNVHIIRVPIYAYISGRAIYKRNIFRIVDNLNPDILYLHGNDTYGAIRFILKAKHGKYKYITDSHMVDMASKNKFNMLFYSFYKRVVTPKILSDRATVIRTSKSDFVERRLGIPLVSTITVDFGSDETLFSIDLEQRTRTRKQLKINNEAFIVLFAGKLDESKGGMFLSTIAKEKIKANKEVVFLIIGNTVGEYGKQVEKNFSESENTVIRIPTQTYLNLHNFYQCADLAIIPKQCSLSIFDFEACGLPVICEDNDINKERLERLEGRCFEKDNLESARRAIEYYANLSNSELCEVSKLSAEKAKKYFGYSNQYKIYMDAIKASLNN